jgi:diketogulonate reductase-like aldo/keto reductase
MYGDGRSEELVGEAIAGRRDGLFIVSKVYPHNASRRAMRKSCEASLRRLGVEAIDLYLLHWPGSVPLAETVEAFEALKAAGKIRQWGVSNFDRAGMDDLWSVPAGRAAQANQVLYNLGRRGVEWDLQPWLRRERVPLMAYSPLEQGRLLGQRALAAFAQKHAMTPAQVALAWLLSQEGVIAIPRSGRPERIADFAGTLEKPLSPAALSELDALFPPPGGPAPLEML